MMQTGRIASVIGIGLTAVLLAGCQKDEIRSYEVPKAEAVAGQGAKGPVRLLAAIFARDDRTWFFKLTGPAEQVESQKSAFDQFIHSVKFTNQPTDPVIWTLPPGWKREVGTQLRFATIKVEAAPALDLSITALGKEAGSLLANINRWRGQIGLADVSEAELASVTKEVTIEGAGKATTVDMTGPGTAKKSPPFAGMRGGPFSDKAAPARPELTYTTPEGWQKVDRSRSAFPPVAAFEVRDGGKTAETTVTVLPGPAGGVEANVNRWRTQLRLEPVPEAELEKDLKPIDVGGTPARFVELVGPESAGPARERILGVVLVRGDSSWFFKMKGPADVVEKQKPAFEAFVRSVRFGEGKGAHP